MRMILAAAAAFLASGVALAQTTPPAGGNPPSGTMTNPPQGTTEDSLSGSRMATQPVSPAETSARDSLTRGGYTDVRDWVQDGDGWRGTAMYNGQRVKVRVGADGKPVRLPNG